VSPHAPRALVALGLLGVVALLVGGCASKSSPAVFAGPTDSPNSSPRDPADPSPTLVATSETLPLTGLPARGQQPAVPVVAVALPAGNTADSGAAKAETVYVEYSDSLRLLALYQSVTAVHLGPVEQTRPADGSILGVTHAIYANAGGPTGFVTTLRQAAVTDASSSIDPAAFLTTPSGLFTSTDALRQGAAAAKSAPPVFTFAAGEQSLAKAAKPAHQLTVSVPGRVATTWNYDATAQAWTTSDPAFAGTTPRSLIVQQVPYKTVQLHHPDGAYVPSARVFGHGSATVVSGPSGVAGQWSKSGPEGVTVFGDSSGVPLHIAPGVTWVLLVPAGTPVDVA
jgi:hypothetical protein